MIALNANRKAFLDMLAWSEIGPELLAVSFFGYNVLVGSTPTKPLLFTDYATHPNVFNAQFDSTAAGAYQIIHPTFIGLCNKYGFTNFMPSTQDAMALNLINERGALDNIDAGNIATAIIQCSFEWASLPGNGSGQHLNSLTDLQDIYVTSGGILSTDQTA